MITNDDDRAPAHSAGDDNPGAHAPRTDDPAERARDLLRRTAPSESVAAILDLDTGRDGFGTVRRQVLGGVEELTGLRLGELQALMAVADGDDHHRTIARRTGQVDAAAAVTVDGLIRKGVLAPHHHPAEPHTEAEPTLVHLTPHGHAVLGQSEAIRVRLLDTIVASLNGADLDEVRSAAETLTQMVTASLGDASRQLVGGRTRQISAADTSG